LGQQAAPHSPELDRADERVDTAKSKVDQAHKQLAAAKAMVKAAEAELKASRADRDALALRNDAQQLADAAGIQSTAVLPDNSIRQVIIPPQGNRLAPVPAAVNPIPVQPAARAQAQSLVEFNAQPADVAAPAKDLSPSPGAPAPSADLKPQMQPEPNSVP
jgi:multidrug resistance efflux pump